MFGGIDLMSARFVRHSFAPHCHDELMIAVIHAGVKAFRHGRSRELAAPGSLSVVNPGEMHTGGREHGKELAYAALYLPRTAVASMLPDRNNGCSIVRKPVIDDQEIWRYLASAHRLIIAGDDAVSAEEAMTWGISLLFQRHGANRPVLPDAGCSRTLNRATAFLQAYACDPISLEDVSKETGIGLFHLIRLFKRHLGLTPYAYLTQIRIARSRQLLNLGEPVAHVALDVGFADQAHFTKRFKQLTGTTPAHYAKSMQ
jgi:AraC-like DNA-binding protein